MKKSIRNLSAVTTVGLDIAKNVLQVHGVDAAGAVVAGGGIPARPAAGVLRFAAIVPGGDRGVQFGALLGACADRDGPPGEADAAGLCEALSLPSGLTRGSGATR